AINIKHPFGLRIWKPALYRKFRSIDTKTYKALHAVPGEKPARPLYLNPGNVLWCLLFGWWISLVYVLVALLVLAPVSLVGKVLLNISGYMFWPFGKFIAKRRMYHMIFEQEDALDGSHADEQTIPYDSQERAVNGSAPKFSPHHGDEDAGNLSDESEDSWREYQSSSRRYSITVSRAIHWQEWVPRWIRKLYSAGLSGCLFRLCVIVLIGPLHLVITCACTFFVFSLPMAKLNYVLLKHLLRHPLQISAHTPLAPEFQVILCTYNALGWEYYKYTIDGINIIFINLIAVVAFALLDFYFIGPTFGFHGIASMNVIFSASLISSIPLAYFIGMAVASITSETGSLAIGAVINATFGSIIEIILYMLALSEGKTRVVEGAVVGSLLAGLLALPGVSMFFGGIKRKEQRFNAKAAGVTATMLIMAVVGCFTPTLFQEIYGTQELTCLTCPKLGALETADAPTTLLHRCIGCRMRSTPPFRDSIYVGSTRYLVYFCSGLLILMYAVGLLFTLRTHSRGDDWDSASAHSSDEDDDSVADGGHDHPNWGLTKSAIVLLGCTVLYSLVAEVLISSVDSVVEKMGIGEKVLGVTLFSWVPLVTEFYNAIAFAMNNNIALSLEIGSAYVMQAAMLQIPMQSASQQHDWTRAGPHHHAEGFTMIFPRWDLYAVIFGTFILTYIYIEGKANYFKGSMLLGAYAVLCAVYFFEPNWD
ncbi:uncharacterized protein EV422DRAFT_495651, partial [Fimicolochytrium jonesii]|uniref:uncharacterized protein n=1 Tax=Fimicolochytrium jonesii TaxID=1396493 RepID=UPI0022FE3551